MRKEEYRMVPPLVHNWGRIIGKILDSSREDREVLDTVPDVGSLLEYVLLVIEYRKHQLKLDHPLADFNQAELEQWIAQETNSREAAWAALQMVERGLKGIKDKEGAYKDEDLLAIRRVVSRLTTTLEGVETCQTKVVQARAREKKAQDI